MQTRAIGNDTVRRVEVGAIGLGLMTFDQTGHESMADRGARLGSLEDDESFRRLDPDSGDILPDVIDGVEHVSE